MWDSAEALTITDEAMRLYRQANRVVTVTEAFRQNLISRGVPAAKVSYVEVGGVASDERRVGFAR